MKLLRLAVAGSALALLGGCVAIPYDAGYYGDAPGYYPSGDAYYGAPYYYGPSVGIGIYGGGVFGGHRGRHHYRGGYSDGWHDRWHR